MIVTFAHCPALKTVNFQESFLWRASHKCVCTNNTVKAIAVLSSLSLCLTPFNLLCFRERNCLLKEAEVLHKAMFNYIIQIFGICNEPEFFCIVTEFMSNGSLDLLLHEVAIGHHVTL